MSDSQGWYVEEMHDGRWIRHALGFIWANESDAHQQLKRLRKNNPAKAFRVAGPACLHDQGTVMSVMDSKTDPASVWIRRTPRQRAQAAARYDREARETLARIDAERTQRAIASAVVKAFRHASLFPPELLRSARKDGRPYSREEITCMKDCMRDAWKTLKRYGSEFVTVL